MKTLKPLAAKRTGKTQREKEILLGLIDTYLSNGKPVGSNTLKDAGFEHLSSATIRNYFAKLEEEGYLNQQHTSGGRIPTEKAFRFYALEYADAGLIDEAALTRLNKLKNTETREITTLIRKCAEELSDLSRSAVFVSAPRFDRDFVIDIKIVPIDQERCLCVLITDFGTIQPEVLQVDQKLTTLAAKRIESYLHSRLTGQERKEPLEPEEVILAQKIYNEAIVRFLVGYTNYLEEDVMRTGFSNLLHYPEFRDPALLAESMALFENSTSMRHLLRDCAAHQSLRFWIGADLLPYLAKQTQTAVIAMPYMINNQPVGAFGLLGPLRMPYRHHFGLLQAMSQALSDCLTKNLYKFKLTFRQPERNKFAVAEPMHARIEHKPIKLIEHRKR